MSQGEAAPQASSALRIGEPCADSAKRHASGSASPSANTATIEGVGSGQAMPGHSSGQERGPLRHSPGDGHDGEVGEAATNAAGASTPRMATSPRLSSAYSSPKPAAESSSSSALSTPRLSAAAVRSRSQRSFDGQNSQKNSSSNSNSDNHLATPKSGHLPRRASELANVTGTQDEGDARRRGGSEIASVKQGGVSQTAHASVPLDRDLTAHGLPKTLDMIASNVTMPSVAKEDSIVKSRQGSVLTRGLVLKTDFFAGMRRPNLGVLLQGAPNFRQADFAELQVYGVAQPTITGLKTILSVLQCNPLQEVSSSRQERGRPDVSVHESTERSVSSSPARTLLKSRAAANLAPSASSHVQNTSQTKRRCVWACTRNEPVVYVSGRPFVLRDSERPLENFQLSGRASNLESIEHRLKADILRESYRYGGLLMVHEEDEKGGLRPAWIAVDADEVKTVREVWDDIRRAGWRCDYHRIPIAEDQPMESNYLDAYTQVIKDIDPIHTAFVANCGLGMRRTSFAMVAAVLVRRRQMLLLGYADPFKHKSANEVVKDISQNGKTAPRRSAPANGVARSMEVASQQQLHARSTLEVVKTLTASLESVGGQQSAVELLLYQPLLLNALRDAQNGDYGVVGQLIGLLDHGDANKAAVDEAINACAHVINLRHSILEARIRYAVAPPDQEKSHGISADAARASLRQAIQALEQYYLLVTFASYVEGSETAIFQHRFATWLKSRAEIWHTVSKIRSKGEKLYFFDPIADLSALSRRATNQDARGQSSIIRRNDTDPHLVPGDEFADHVVRNRSGLVLRPDMLLKEDIWRSLNLIDSQHSTHVRGTVNFRHIPNTRIFATGQPTVDGIRNILRVVGQRLSIDADKGPLQVTYINLREEPICHVNGKPYCLRQKGMSLRNIKSYSGISWNRLTLLEDRLKNDVLDELRQGDGCLLLHTETEDGGVVPTWEEASAGDIDTLQDVMTKIDKELERSASAQNEKSDASLPNVHLIYRRLPITAEKPPSFEDLASIVRAVLRSELQANACVVLNCQLGRGRSTLVSILAVLVSRWLHRFQGTPAATGNNGGSPADTSPRIRSKTLSYHLINSLLRVVPKGLEVKATVDSAIDQCDQVVNIREAIEDARIAAESTDDEQIKHGKVQNGIYNFRRYFQLIVFQAYLDATPPSHVDSMPSFESFVRRQPVFSTFWSESDKIDIATITPLHKVDASEGAALDDEVQEVVSKRGGSVLSTFTMLKSDMFPGLAAQALSQIEGIPNLRGESVFLGRRGEGSAMSLAASESSARETDADTTWGHGMPSLDGLRRGLEKIGAGPDGQHEVVATSLREEAVCVVNGRPHVLRLADQPFTNVETTGITTEAVERMEEDLKHDVIQELRKYEGRILLHDETVNEATGKFDLIPIWQHVREEDVLTPKEMYEMVIGEGYHVQYARVAVTDEQAPIPAVFHEMEERVLKALRQHASCIWNCQMGRGRTTTGMVIAALVSTVAQRGEEIFGGPHSFNGSFLSGSLSSFLSKNADESATSASESVDSREDELLLRGEYRTVLQLVAILKHGKLAKRLTDAAIDRMEAVQNLRKAIYDSKLRAANADASSGRRSHLMRVYRNYLERYGYLIVFANYLLEKAHAMVEAGVSTKHFGVGTTPRPANGTSNDAGTDSESNAEDDASIDAQGEDALASSMTSTSALSLASNETAASLFVHDEQRLIFPNFIHWLQPRREIHSILGRDQLE